MIANYLASQSHSVLWWLIDGIHLRVWATLNIVLISVVFWNVLESVKIDSKLEKAIVFSILLSLILLELLLLSLLWLVPPR